MVERGKEDAEGSKWEEQRHEVLGEKTQEDRSRGATAQQVSLIKAEAELRT